MEFMIPNNAKRSLLILGIFNPIDAVIFSIGTGLSILLLMAVKLDSTFMVILALIPGLLGGFLVFPIPNYHNTLTILISAFKYYTKRQNYIWKGWCYTEDGNK